MPKSAPAPADVVELLQAMVRIDSVNSGVSGRPRAEDELRDWLHALLDSWQLTARRLPVAGQADQLLVTYETPARADAPWLLFDSHLDTVAVEGMTVDPFGAQIDGDRMIGRGTCDTKGTGAAMLWAMREYIQNEHQPNHIALLFSVDEEVSMSGARSFVTNDLPNLGWRPAGVIVGEPTDFHPVSAHNGAIRWYIRTHGQAAHSSVPHKGRSAISAMVKVIQAIESQYIPGLSARHPMTGQAVCSINTIRGGTSHNIIPDRCEVQVDRRLVPGEDHAAVMPTVEALLASLGVEFSQEVRTIYPPLEDQNNGPLVAATQRVLADMGTPNPALGAPFCTNAGAFSAAGLPTVVVGPGSMLPAHTKDEWVSISAIQRGVELYRRLMQADVT